MKRYERMLEMKLPEGQSAFLWGARKTGKSTYLREHFKGAVYYDLLKTDLYFEFLKEPSRFREEILALSEEQLREPIIVDEVQKLPMLLDEIHWLIENRGVQFILCGSSARKLKKTGANLLGGRAWKYVFFPLVYPEISDFDLLKVLNYGTIPSHYCSTDPRRSLKAYVEDYLDEEVKHEGLVRNLPAFAKFLDSMGYSNGQLTNYVNIARECGVDTKTVKEYYQILEDTLLGYFLMPYRKQKKRVLLSSMAKFYLFDVGVANMLSKSHIEEVKGSVAGGMLEHYVLTELMAYRGLKDLDMDITYWRTRTGLEVDFIVSGREMVAIEVKVSEVVEKGDIKGLLAFAEEHPESKRVVVCMGKRARLRVFDGVEVLFLPVEEFLKDLWAGSVI